MPQAVIIGPGPRHWDTLTVIAVVLFSRAGERRLADRGILETLVQLAPDTSMGE
jgi:hypothetical protein